MMETTGGGLLVAIRHATDDGARLAPPDGPLAGLELIDEAGTPLGGAEPSRGGLETLIRFPAPAGRWRLRLEARGGEPPQEFPILLPEGWGAWAFFPARDAGVASRVDLGRASVRLLRPSAPVAAAVRDVHMEEAALQALVGEAPIPVDPIRQLIRGSSPEASANPVLGLCAGHLLPCEGEEDRDLLAGLIDGLDALLRPIPGRDGAADFPHPDVAALRLKLARMRPGGPAIPPLPFPPMLAASWEILLDSPGAIAPRSLADRVARSPRGPGPWLIWEAPSDS